MTTAERRAQAPPRSALRKAGHLLRRAVVMEIVGYLSIYRFVFRRPRVPAGASAFTYHEPVLVIHIVFIVGSAVEVAVVDLIVHRWPAVRIPLLVLGVWGVVWMLGMLFGFLTRPHAVGPAGIRVRHGAETDIPLGWDDIDQIALRKRRDDGEKRIAWRDDGSAALNLRIMNETNIDITLTRPMEFRLPQGHVRLTEIRIHADEPRAFLDAARPYF